MDHNLLIEKGCRDQLNIQKQDRLSCKVLEDESQLF